MMKRLTGKIAYGRIAALLALLVVLTASYLNGTGLLAKMASEGTGEDSARVAAFVFRYGEENTLDLSEITKPGDSETYTFTVTNSSGSAVSEVAQAYTLKASLHGSMPIVCTIKKGGTAVLTLDAADGTDPEKEGTTASVTMPAASGMSDTYTLTAEWPAVRNDIKYANGSGTSAVTIGAAAEQID